MSKILENLRPDLFEGMPNKTNRQPKKVEKDRYYWNILPGMKNARPFLNQKEYLEACGVED